MTKSTHQKLFGQDGELLLKGIEETVKFLTENQTKYSYLDIDSFNSLTERDPFYGIQIYWQEILGRAHFAAASSLIRSHRWCAGIIASYENKLFLPYCACFRALIESVADTYDALNSIAASLAENKKAINELLLKNSDKIIVSKELEDKLIHFAYARKI